MKKEQLFEAFGEISSRTIQANTAKNYRARVLSGYMRWAAVAAAIIAVGTGLYVFGIADSTHRIKEEPAESSGMQAGESAMLEEAVEAEEAPASEVPAAENHVVQDSGSKAQAEFSEEAFASEEAAEYEEAADDMPVTEAAEDVAISKESTAEKNDSFELKIKFPENPNWIRIISQNVNGNRLEIKYKDLIADADCILMGVRDGELDLPDIDYGNAKTKTWEYVYSIIDGKHDNSLTMTQSENKKDILLTWMYEDYKFAVVAAIKGEDTDPAPIVKTAYYIIEQYARAEEAERNAENKTPDNTVDAP